MNSALAALLAGAAYTAVIAAIARWRPSLTQTWTEPLTGEDPA